MYCIMIFLPARKIHANIIVFGLIACLHYSCKHKKNSSSIEVKKPIDTVYCNYDKNPIAKTIKTQMYNEPYTCVLDTKNLKNEQLSYKKDSVFHVCYQKETHILLYKEKDTIFNITVDINLLKKEYAKFYNEYKRKVNTKDNNLPNVIIPEMPNNIKLDSVVHSGARADYLYFTTYIEDYNTHKKYTFNIGVNYKNKKKEKFLASQLIELK